jgi:hypothetical protein
LGLTGPKGGATTTLSRSDPNLLKILGKEGPLGSGLRFGSLTGVGAGFVFSQVNGTAKYYSDETTYSEYVGESARSGAGFAVAALAGAAAVAAIPVTWPALAIAGAGIFVGSVAGMVFDYFAGEHIGSAVKTSLDQQGFGYTRGIGPLEPPMVRDLPGTVISNEYGAAVGYVRKIR